MEPVFVNTQPIPHPTFQDRFNGGSIQKAVWFGFGARESFKIPYPMDSHGSQQLILVRETTSFTFRDTYEWDNLGWLL